MSQLQRNESWGFKVDYIDRMSENRPPLLHTHLSRRAHDVQVSECIVGIIKLSTGELHILPHCWVGIVPNRVLQGQTTCFQTVTGESKKVPYRGFNFAVEEGTNVGSQSCDGHDSCNKNTTKKDITTTI